MIITNHTAYHHNHQENNHTVLPRKGWGTFSKLTISDDHHQLADYPALSVDNYSCQLITNQHQPAYDQNHQEDNHVLTRKGWGTGVA